MNLKSGNIRENSVKEILREFEAAAGHRTTYQVFVDAVHLYAAEMELALAETPADRTRIGEDYARTAAKYDTDARRHISLALAAVVNCLEVERRDILGHVLEVMGATNARNGQFFTPPDLACLMARVGGVPKDRSPGQVVTIHDPACGAGVLLIEQAEYLIQHGVHQADLFIDAGDVDARACDIAYVEFSLLGYPAVVRNQDALSMKRFGPDRLTVGYFAHAFPMRGWRNGRKVA